MACVKNSAAGLRSGLVGYFLHTVRPPCGSAYSTPVSLFWEFGGKLGTVPSAS